MGRQHNAINVERSPSELPQIKGRIVAPWHCSLPTLCCLCNRHHESEVTQGHRRVSQDKRWRSHDHEFAVIIAGLDATRSGEWLPPGSYSTVGRVEAAEHRRYQIGELWCDHNRVKSVHLDDANAARIGDRCPIITDRWQALDETVMTAPTPLPPTPWSFPDATEADRYGVVGVGADLEPATLIHAYRSGMFPMPADVDSSIAWWSPSTRGVLEFTNLVVSRSLRRSCRRYEVTVNRAFEQVITACASLPRSGSWISPEIVNSYRRLHELGWAHSVETWLDGELVGGLYGVQVAGLFAGESMFHVANDASKVALVGLVSALEVVGATLLDVQWRTDHLATLGVRSITRGEYLERLRTALLSPASSLAQLSGHNSLNKSQQYLDRILWKPIGSTSS